MDLIEPWHTPPHPKELEKQLVKEVPEGHLLRGTSVRAVAQRQDCDDVLFELLDGSDRVAVVHLTYSDNISPAWPQTKLYPNYAVWLSDRMIPDSQEFDA